MWAGSWFDLCVEGFLRWGGELELEWWSEMKVGLGLGGIYLGPGDLSVVNDSLGGGA
jgi:hypothetical protein